jgi:menaquinone-dependent protoporphyrinogen oxidase
MPRKIIVAYATRAGSTAEVAECVGKELSERGVEADVRPVKEVRSLDGYDSVVLGTAVRMGKPMPEVVKFVRVNRPWLAKIPVAAFSVSLIMEKDTPQNRTTAAAYLDVLRKEVVLVEEGMFAGKLDFSKLGFFTRFIMTRMVKSPESDSRDWKKIRDWTAFLIGKLRKAVENK